VKKMRLVTTVADRLLSAVVPRATAGACCPPDPWEFVVLGDNAARSYDSRQLGYIPADRLLGVVRRQLARR
jgi:signal peptidase I